MPRKVMLLVGSKKGVFILESDGGAALAARRTLLRKLADSSRRRRSARRRDLRRRRKRMVRSGGMEVARRRRPLDAFEPRPCLRRRARRRSRRAWTVARRPRPPVRRRRAGGAVRQRRRRRELARRSRACADTHAAAMAARRRGLDAALDRHRSRRPARIWVGISSVGVFYTRRRRRTWTPRNTGTRCDFLPEGERYPEFGQCVHNLTLAPGGSNRLYQQNHCGMYRSDDGGASWLSIEDGFAVELRLSRRRASARPRHAVLLAAQRRHQAATRLTRSAAVWRSATAARIGATARRAAAGGRLFRRDAAGDGDRRARARRRLFRHEQRLGLRQPRRGRELGLHRARPAGVSSVETMIDGHDARARVVRLPASADGAVSRRRRASSSSRPETVDEVIDALDARWPGMRDRLCDSTPAMRRHINVFVDGKRAPARRRRCRQAQTSTF